jgi:predicted MFS family arabinose efflux permease
MAQPRSILDTATKGRSSALSPAALQSLLMIVLQAAAFMVSAEARLIAPVLHAMAVDLRTSVATAGLLITSYALPYGAFQLVYGPLADRFRRQRVLAVALGLFAIGTLVSGVAPTFGILIALRVATGAAAAGVMPVALAYISDVVPYGERQAALGRMVSIAALGGVVSAALGGVMAELVSWRVLFLGYGALALPIAIILLRLPARAALPQAGRAPGLLGPYRTFAARGGARAAALYALVFVEGFAAMSTIGYLGALLVTRDQLSYGLVGALLTLNAIGMMIAARFAGRLVARLGEEWMVRVGGIMMVAGYLMITLSPTLLWFPLAMVMSGIGFAVAHSTLQTRATELVPEQRGTSIALFAFSLCVGSGLGTYVAGLGIDVVGYTPTILGTAAVLAIFTIAGVPVLRARPRAGRE